MNFCIVAYLQMSESLDISFIKCDQNQSKIQSRFLGSIGSLFAGLEELLGAGGSGRFSGPFGDSWDRLWKPLGVLGVCFADA